MEFIKDHILLVMDNEKRAELVYELIKNNVTDARIYKVLDINDALSLFLNDKKIDLIIIDNESSNFDAFELLKKMKKINPKIGVLILSENITKELSLKALNYGAYNLLSLDKHKENVLINIRGYFHGLQNDKLNVEIIQFLIERKTKYQIPNSLKYVPVVSYHLTRDLTQVGLVDEDQSENIKFGIQEILINAIEHGNLDISYKEKTMLLKKGYDLPQIIEKYSKRIKYSKRKVSIEFTLTREKAIYVIKDQGKGFDWRALSDFSDSKKLILEHGRGIMISKRYFDELNYNEKGNEVTLIVNKKK
ncbi:MAG: ATP-binding protein [Spirochaetes bacterium]|nr:ATP-binding protein [Spirochaetota bacterium]